MNAASLFRVIAGRAAEAVSGLLLLALVGNLHAANFSQTPDPHLVLTGQTAVVYVQLTAGDGTRAVTYEMDYNNAVYSNAFANNFTGSPFIFCVADVPNRQLRAGWNPNILPLPAGLTTMCEFQLQVRSNAPPGNHDFTVTNTRCTSGTCTTSGNFRVTVSLPPVDPTLTYSPPTGSTVTLSGGDIGGTGAASIGVTPSGHQGAGATGVHSCGFSGSGAGAFGPVVRVPANGIYTTNSGSLNLSCTRQASQRNATLTCTEQGSSVVKPNPMPRSWPVQCPAGIPNIPPTLSYVPAPGGSAAGAPLVSASGPLGAVPDLVIPVSGSGGSGSGAAATARVSDCQVTPATGSAGVFACTPTTPGLDFTPGGPDPGDIECSCNAPAGGSYSSSLRCTELSPVSGGSPQFRYWSLACDAVAAAPVVDLQGPASVGVNQQINLSWTATGTAGTTPCSPSGGAGTGWAGSGPLAASGSQSVTAPATAQTLDFGLSCANGNASGQDSLSVQVLADPPPLVQLLAPSSVLTAAPISLSWSASGTMGVTPCTPSGGAGTGWASAGPLPAIGSQTVTAPATAQTLDFILSCSSGSSSGEGSASVQVLLPPPPQVSLSLNPAQVMPAQSFQISWSATNVSAGAACTPSGGGSTNWRDSGALAGTGQLSLFAPDSDGSYSFSLSCSGPGGNGEAQATLVVSTGLPQRFALIADPLEIGQGGALSLSWNANLPARSKGGDCIPSLGPGTVWPQLGALIEQGRITLAAPLNAGLVRFRLSCGERFGEAEVVVRAVNVPPGSDPPRLESELDGLPLDGSSVEPRLSVDGRWLVFVSQSATGGAKGEPINRVLLRDRVSGELREASVDQQGQPLTLPSGDPAISGDGQAVAFVDGDGQMQIYSAGLGRTQGTISAGPQGAPGNGPSAAPSLSGDGTVVVFESAASNLGPEDGNGAVADIYWRDLNSGQFLLLSQRADGSALDGPSAGPTVSADGRVVAFHSSAGNLSAAPQQSAAKGAAAQVCIATVASGGLGRTRGCVSSNPLSGVPGNADSRDAVLSADGRHLAFTSAATNLVDDDDNGVADIYWAELDEAGSPLGLVRVSLAADGSQADGPSGSPSISADGRYVAFQSMAGNLVPGDDNQSLDVFVKDVRDASIVRLGIPVDAQPDGDNFQPALSADGGTLAFTSLAGNLGGGGDGLADVYSQSTPSAPLNLSYTWWQPSEPGWGYNLSHQGDLLYGTWYTYAEDGAVMFLTVEAVLQADGSYAGPVYRVAGTPFAQIGGGPAFTAVTEVGSAMLRLLAGDRLQLDYQIGDTSQRKLLQRFVFDPAAPRCIGGLDSRSGSQNYSDLWWNPGEAGWGLTLSHQGEVIFLLWYTYGEGGRDQWISGAMLLRQPDGSFAGALERPASGTPLAQISGPATAFPVPQVGSATLRFVDGENGSFSYTLDGVTQTRLIERFVAVPAGALLPLCQ